VGAVHFSVDLALVQLLRDSLSAVVFIESGTFHGDTVFAVKDLFQEVYSIENSPVLFERASRRFERSRNVKLLLGESPVELRKLGQRFVADATVFFLDAHWCGAEGVISGGPECPLLDELHAIHTLNSSSVIIIDDARLFLSAPPLPHDPTEWPNLGQVLDALRALSNDHDVTVIDDCIIFYPLAIGCQIREFSREQGVDTLKLMARYRALDAEERARTDLPTGRDLDGRSIPDDASVLEKCPFCTEMDKEARRVSATLSAVQQELCDKQEIIDELAAALQAYRLAHPVLQPISGGFRIARNLGRLAIPKLGRLHHHPPIPLRLPGSYTIVGGQERLPSISIVTPSFNQGKFIERTIQSVLGQAYPRIEYVIQDGGSKDETLSILKRYLDENASYESMPDGGQAQAINMGFSRTSGEIMGWLNSDDILLPDALRFVGDYFARNPEVDVVYGNRILIDEDDNEIGRWVLPEHDDGILGWVDFMPQETLFWRRRLWERAGGRIDESFRFAMDWDLLLRFRDAGAKMVRLPRFLGGFRIHQAQKTTAQITAVGLREMDLLRARALGHSNYGYAEIRRAITPYLLRHLMHDLAFRFRNRLSGFARRSGNAGSQ
jgi:glycosyltransferase involved in cell wall biosynthesis